MSVGEEWGWVQPTVGELRRMLERHSELPDDTPLYALLAGDARCVYCVVPGPAERWGEPSGGLIATREGQPVLVLTVREGLT